MSNNTLNPTRQLLVDKYILALKQDKIPFEQQWVSSTRPMNAITGTAYRGVNNLLLSYITNEDNLQGNRWATFRQIADQKGQYHKGEKWHLRKGSKGVPIEYCYLFNKVDKKKYTLDEYFEAIENGDFKPSDFVWRRKNFTVFHESCIDGIPPLPEIKHNTDIERNKVIDTLIKNMNISVEECNYGDSAYYSPRQDKVFIPSAKRFKSNYDYSSVLVHELSHATGHHTRLNRNMSSAFGSDDYAKEELRAEISSSFFCSELDIPVSDENTKNHLSYVQSWISVLENDPNELFRAIKDSDKIVEYLEKKSETDRFIKLDFKHEPTDIQLDQDVLPAQSPQEVAKNARERAEKRNNSDKSKDISIDSKRQALSR